MDLLPTVAETLRAAPLRGSSLEGISLWPYLRAHKVRDKDRAIHAQRKPMPVLGNDLFAVLTTQHEYILDTNGEDRFFDVLADPMQRVNEIESPAAAHQLDLILEELEALGY